MSEAELDKIIKINSELKKWQETPDSEENLKSIPSLLISDIKADVEKIPQKIEKTDNITTLIHDVATNGITYAELLFDVSDLNENEIFDLRLLTTLILNVSTEKHSALELQNIIKANLGSFSVSASPVTKNGAAKLYLSVSASALDSQKELIAKVTEEVLYTSIYKNKEVAGNLIRQMKMSSEEYFIDSGHLAAFRRASAYSSAEAVISEYYSGYEAHIKIKELDKRFDEEFEALSGRLTALAERIFTKNRLIISVTGTADKEFIKLLISSVKDGKPFNPISKISPFGIRREGILIPAQVGYASLSLNLGTIEKEACGSLNVTRSLLSYSYLWNAVRVQGGAYGVGLIARNNGNVGFYSYRDPSPSRSVFCYKNSGDFLRKFAESGENITKFIIGAVGDASPLTSPKLKGSLATSRYLRGIDYEYECKTRREMLETDHEELLRIADIIDSITKSDAICVVGGKEQLDACKDIIATVLEI